MTRQPLNKKSGSATLQTGVFQQSKFSGLFKKARMQGAQKNASRGVYKNTLSDEFCSATLQTGVFQQARGFTLLEILIAIFILAVVMSTVYASYTNILKNSRQIEEEGAVYKMARTAMDRIIKDLSSLQATSGSFYMEAKQERLGKRDFPSIYFWSASHIVFDENEEEGRPGLIGYYVRQNEDGESFSLWRTDASGTKQDKAKNPEGGFIICKNIDTFKLTFYDSRDRETDSWNSSSSTVGDSAEKTPSAVKIELFLVNAKDPEKPYKFMTKIFLPITKQKQ